MTRQARITGKVEFRQGDGVNKTIRVGPCEIEETALDATISWNDGESGSSTAIPIDVYRHYVSSGAIEIVAAQPA